jgi:plasmid stabilization system protein ParE
VRGNRRSPPASIGALARELGKPAFAAGRNMKLEWSDQALSDLGRFAEFLHGEQPSLASAVGAGIMGKAQVLANQSAAWNTYRLPPRFEAPRGHISHDELKIALAARAFLNRLSVCPYCYGICKQIFPDQSQGV